MKKRLNHLSTFCCRISSVLCTNRFDCEVVILQRFRNRAVFPDELQDDPYQDCHDELGEKDGPDDDDSSVKESFWIGFYIFRLYRVFFEKWFFNKVSPFIFY